MTTSEVDNQKEMSLTVGIPTCYGGESLIETVKGLRASQGVSKFRLVIVADRTPIPDSIKEELTSLGVELYWNETEGSQMKKVKQIIATLDTDIFVHTQDDIIFRPDTLQKLLQRFAENPEITMVGARVLPLKPQGLFESAMASMVRIVDRLACQWKDGGSRLAASGRCLAYRVKHLKQMNIPEGIVNSDMYTYLENRRRGGRFALAQEARVYIRCPQRLRDQIGPSSRYQYQPNEMKRYFPEIDLQHEYRSPKWLMFQAVLAEFLRRPFSVALYFLIFAYTRLNRQQTSKITDPVWDVDTSTKKVN